MIPIISIPVSAVLSTIVAVVATMRTGTATIPRATRVGPMFMPISGPMTVGRTIVI